MRILRYRAGSDHAQCGHQCVQKGASGVNRPQDSYERCRAITSFVDVITHGVAISACEKGQQC